MTSHYMFRPMWSSSSVWNCCWWKLVRFRFRSSSVFVYSPVYAQVYEPLFPNTAKECHQEITRHWLLLSNTIVQLHTHRHFFLLSSLPIRKCYCYLSLGPREVLIRSYLKERNAHEVHNLLRCDAAYSSRTWPTLRRKLLPPSYGLNSKPASRMCFPARVTSERKWK
jgi:hypothetical protein